MTPCEPRAIGGYFELELGHASAALHDDALRFQSSRELEVMAAGRPMTLVRGERILLNFRYVLTAEAFRWLITEHAGLRIVGEIPSADERFMTAVCIKA